MSHVFYAGVVAVLLAVGAPVISRASEPIPGASVEGLLSLARERNPEYASMRLEAQAAGVTRSPAGALPDPRLRTELMDITRMGEQNPSILPSNVGSTRYTLMQDVPWCGKRDLKRKIAEFEVQSADGKALTTWSELVAKIKTTQAQRYYLRGNQKLTKAILALMQQLEKISQVR